MNDECDIPCINNESEADGSLLSSSLSQSLSNSQQQQQEEVDNEIDNEVVGQQNYQDNRRSLLPRPNSSLTEEERKHKQNLKKEMKRKRYEERLERRYRHALVRKDPIVANETKNTLESIWSERMTTKTMTTDLHFQNTINSHEHSARQFIESMYHDLQQQQKQQKQPQPKSSSSTTGTIRDIQTFEGVSLLRHMTKGTQSKTMFANVHALWGYTRQKFQSRAMLVYTSLVQVGTRYDDWMYESSSSSTMTCPKQEEEISLRIRKKEMTWEYITTSIQSIVSIGCGPGCDALGVLAFLREHGVQSSSSLDQSKEASTVITSPPPPSSLLQSICFMDYAMDEWYPTILRHLIPLWIPTWVGNVDYTLGDVTKSWMDDDKDVNATFRDIVTRIQPDLYLFSYLLTETRGQWETFLHDVVSQIIPMKTRLLFAEPTPWQLHRLLVVFPELDYLWLDSSHSLSTELQNMEGRLGPAVLMAWKREKNDLN